MLYVFCLPSYTSTLLSDLPPVECFMLRMQLVSHNVRNIRKRGRKKANDAINGQIINILHSQINGQIINIFHSQSDK